MLIFLDTSIHILMEHCSQRLRARATGGLQYETKWFYERARGQYLQKQMRLTRAEKDKFLKQNPKDQLITKTDLAKVQHLGRTAAYCQQGAQSNFVAFSKLINEAWEKDKGLQFGDKYFQETVALCLMFRFSEKMIPQQAWYQQGYRANIVTYTIALLRKKISKKFPEQDLDLIRIWNRQELPDAVKKALVELSEHVYDKLTDPHRGLENVTQWCKREACWENVQKIDYDLHAEIEQCLIGREEMRISDRDAKRDRSIECELDSLTWVNSITADQWLKIKEYAVDKKLVSSEELRALNIAVRLPYMQPTAGQCKKLHNLYERLYEEGYKV